MKKITFLTLAGLGACLGSAAAQAQSSDLQGNWKMVGWTLPTAIPIKAHLPIFGFQGNKISGKAGCNTFNGTFNNSGGNLTFSTLASTRMACPEPVNQQEQAFLQTLSGQTLKVSRVADSLTLTTNEGYMLNIRRSTVQSKQPRTK